MTLIQKFTKALNHSKEGSLSKIVKFEHNGCVYGVQHIQHHRGDRVLVHRCFLGEECGYTLLTTCNVSKAVYKIMLDSQWHHYHKINEFKNRSRAFRRLNNLHRVREQWIGGKCFIIRDHVEYTWIKNRLPWETKYNIFNGVI